MSREGFMRGKHILGNIMLTVLRACVHMCVCVCERERESMCVCVCVCEREREKERE